MRIGLNATCFNDRPSGARQRFVGIYGELVRSMPQTEFVVFEPSDCRVASWFGEAENVTARPTPLPSQGRAAKTWAGLRFGARELRRDGLDLLEGFNLPFLALPGGANVLTIHDIRRHGDDWPWLERSVYRIVLARALAAADCVVTVSETMREEILFFQPRANVAVVYNGLDAQAFQKATESDRLAVREKYRLPQEFVLAVGHLERRKNYPKLIEAMALLRDRGRPVPLVIVGNDSGYRATIQHAIDQAGLAKSVTILSALSDAEVRSLYSLCDLFVFPSTYEGFGIPLLEAMAIDVPMVLSDIPVFREITQGQGAYFRPDDAEAMAAAIDTVLSCESDRDRIRDYGRGRVMDFDFPRLAAQITALHQSLAA